MQIHPRTAVVCSVLLVVSACGTDDPPSPSVPSPVTPATAPEPATATGDDATEAARIPDGRYVRVATTADAEAAELEEDLAGELLGSDGELPMALQLEGDRFEHFVTNDAGVEELGDLGTVDYVRNGEVLLTSESTGCPGCVLVLTWSLDGDALTLTGSPDMDEDAAFIVPGEYSLEER